MAFPLIYLVLSLSLIDIPLNTKNEIFIGIKVQNWFAQTRRSYCKPKAEANSLPFAHLHLSLPPSPGEDSGRLYPVIPRWLSPKKSVSTKILNEAREAEHRLWNRKCPNCSWVQEGTWVSLFLPFPGSFFTWELMWQTCCRKTQRLEWLHLQERLFWESPGAWIGVGAWLAQKAPRACT